MIIRQIHGQRKTKLNRHSGMNAYPNSIITGRAPGIGEICVGKNGGDVEYVE
jgi:hypothetical protein